MAWESAKSVRRRVLGGCDRTTYRTKSVNINTKHPPNQKKTNQCHHNVAGPLAWRLRIAKVKHAAIVASRVGEKDAAFPSSRDGDNSSAGSGDFQERLLTCWARLDEAEPGWTRLDQAERG